MARTNSFIETILFHILLALFGVNFADASCVDNLPDGTLGAGESCDDGNINNGDGCNLSCENEVGWSCSGSPSKCLKQEMGKIELLPQKGPLPVGGNPFISVPNGLPQHGLSGKVIKNNLPYGEMFVELYSSESTFLKKSDTDANGSFNFSGLAIGKYQLVLAADGLDLDTAEVALENVDQSNLALSPRFSTLRNPLSLGFDTNNGMKNIIELTNRGSQVINIAAVLRDRTGTIINTPSPIAETILPESSREIIISDLQFLGPNKKGTVTLNVADRDVKDLLCAMSVYGSENPVTGRPGFAYRLPCRNAQLGNTVLLVNNELPSSDEKLIGSLADNRITLLNLDSGIREFFVRFYSVDGTPIEEEQHFLRGYQRFDIPARTAIRTDRVYLVEVVANDLDKPYQVYGTRYEAAEPTNIRFATAYYGQEGHSQNQCMSLTNGADSRTYIELGNRTAASATVTANLFDSNGAIIELPAEDKQFTIIDHGILQKQYGRYLPEGTSGKVCFISTGIRSLVIMGFSYRFASKENNSEAKEIITGDMLLPLSRD